MERDLTAAEAATVHRIPSAAMQPAPPADHRPDDPNRTQAGARRRVGPFWVEEPWWFWVAALAVLLLGALALTLAILGDPP